MRLPTNEMVVLRVRTAMVKITAAIKSVFGMAKIRMPCRCACQETGPQRSASTQGIYFASKMPADTPRIGITETTAEPRKRPARNAGFFRGVEKRICQVLFAKSRDAAEFTNAVTISSVKTEASA